MFMKELKHVMVQGMKDVFQSPDYPETDFQGFRDNADEYPKVNIGIEYPVSANGYPGVWVNFSPTDSLRKSGIDNAEYTLITVDGESVYQKVTRWMFRGLIDFTVFALSSLERDRLLDEVIKVVAAPQNNPLGRGLFRQSLIDTPLLAVQPDFDTLSLQGESASQGTPWGSDDIIYEITVGMGLMGEFVDDAYGTLIRLTDVIVQADIDSTP